MIKAKKWFINLHISIKVAIIAGIFLLIATIIGGIFTLYSGSLASKSEKEDHSVEKPQFEQSYDSQVKDSLSTTNSEQTNNFQIIDNLSPIDILKAINAVPPLQQDDIAKHYIGLEVEWTGTVATAGNISDDMVSILLKYGDRMYGPTIYFAINKSDNPGITLIELYTDLKVKGVIKKIDSRGITLEDVKIIK